MLRERAVRKLESEAHDINKDDFSLVLLAAGRGARMGSKINKNFLTLADNPVIYYSLREFSGLAAHLVLVIGDKDKRKGLSIAGRMDYESIEAVAGGRERYDSVINGLERVNTKYVFIHDCARCLITRDIIVRCAKVAADNNASIAAVPVKDTIKLSAPNPSEGVLDGSLEGKRGNASVPLAIEDTPDRSRLWQAQTPQCFKTDLIKKAYSMARERDIIASVTDDAKAVEEMGERVYLVKGDYTNIKITEPGDLPIAEAILRARN